MKTPPRSSFASFRESKIILPFVVQLLPDFAKNSQTLIGYKN